MRRGIPQAKGVPSQSTSVMQAAAGYLASLVLDQFGPCAGTRPGTKADLLCEQITAGA